MRGRIREGREEGGRRERGREGRREGQREDQREGGRDKLAFYCSITVPGFLEMYRTSRARSRWS